jgi:hypothetical protein
MYGSCVFLIVFVVLGICCIEHKINKDHVKINLLEKNICQHGNGSRKT